MEVLPTSAKVSRLKTIPGLMNITQDMEQLDGRPAPENQPIGGGAGSAPASSPAMQRILALLAMRSPLSAKDIAEHAYVALSTLAGGAYLKTMKGLGLIRIEGWAKNSNGFTTPLYALGAGPDCPRPRFVATDRDSLGMARIVAVLKRYPRLDYREIAREAGVSANTIRNAGYMDSLVQQGRIHVSAWRRNRQGRPCALYSVGPGENVPEPQPLGRQEIMRRHRERKRVLSALTSSLQQQLKAVQV